MSSLKKGDTVYISVDNRPSMYDLVHSVSGTVIVTETGGLYHATPNELGSHNSLNRQPGARLWPDLALAKLYEWKWDIRRQLVDYVERYVWLPGTADDQVAEIANLLGVKLLERPSDDATAEEPPSGP